MDNKEVTLLKKALERQKRARQQAERILEEKSNELYEVTHHLKQANSKLENLLSEKTSELDGVFINIIDPYLVMDMSFNVINMNESAKQFLGFDSSKESVNLTKFVHPDFAQYTLESMQSLMEVGTLKNYRAKIVINEATEKWVEINSSLVYNKERKPIAAQGVIRDITQEMEIKTLLSNQKRQLDIIVENSPLGIILIKDGKFVKVNNTFSQMIGYSEQELKNLCVDAISSPENVEESNLLLAKLKKGEVEKFTIVRRYRPKRGGVFIARTMVNYVNDGQGSQEYQVAIIEDISKEREAEKKVEASENRLSTLISNLNTAVLLEDENKKVALANKMFCSLFEIDKTPEELKGADSTQFIEIAQHAYVNPKEFRKRVEKILLERKMVLSDELETLDGRYLERDFIPIYTDGVYKGHLWAFNDVTISKNYKRNLEKQREKYSSIIANMNLGLMEVDNDDKIQMVNQSFCQMSGYTEEELLGKTAHNVFNVPNDENFEERDKRRAKGNSDSYEIEVRNKKGEIKHWLISGAPRYNDSGKIIGSIGIHLDITDQKLLELQKEKLMTELEASNQGLQEYAHIVSHDLKSPLRSISALATWLNEDYKDILDEGGRQNLALMQEKVASMDGLIHGILEYSTANSSALDNSTVDLNEVIAGIKDVIYIPEHVSLEVPKQLPIICADRTKIHQVFQNIIGNAVVHIEKEKGLVEVLCHEEKDFWRFTVKDNGVGIPKEYHKKIFEIFQSIGENERSTGIGLSIVKKIVDRYGGRVWVESEVNVGTEFHFTIKKDIVQNLKT